MFQFKNKTNYKVTLAFTYFDDSENDWISEGWWNIEPGCTATPYSKKLNYRYYYCYAFNDTTQWSGDTEFEINPLLRFKIIRKKSLFYKHKISYAKSSIVWRFRHRKFKRIDVNNFKTFTLELTDKSSTNYTDLTAEEQEIIRRYRTLTDSRKKAIIASENSFVAWLKNSVRWVWDKIKKLADYASKIKDIFNALRMLIGLSSL